MAKPKYDTTKRINKPKEVTEPDFSKLISDIKTYIEDVKSSEAKELKQYIYESALEAVYGPNIFKWITQEESKK